MNTIRLALRNIRGSGWRSLAIFFCVMGIASFLLSTSLIINGAQNSLDVGLRRLGADILVVPDGTEAKVETALLMGKPTSVWMDDTMLERVSKIPGVERVSPQVYLSSLYGAACCSVSEMFIIVFVFAFIIASSCGMYTRLALAALPPAACFHHVHNSHSAPSTTD